jgi:hypothetical protein
MKACKKGLCDEVPKVFFESVNISWDWRELTYYNDTRYLKVAKAPVIPLKNINNNSGQLKILLLVCKSISSNNPFIYLSIHLSPIHSSIFSSLSLSLTHTHTHTHIGMPALSACTLSVPHSVSQSVSMRDYYINYWRINIFYFMIIGSVDHLVLAHAFMRD